MSAIASQITGSDHWPFVRGIHRYIPLTKASDAENVSIMSYILQDYVTYTEGSSTLKFSYERTGERIPHVTHAFGQDTTNLAIQESYDVVAYDSYLQPQANSE